ncbi:ATP-binding protein [Streptomyces otsuchiensis]|uniref:ATP-binding protein n=1 Tax=Streptomyces otsuchiensis TaxID=2681388 RepID=UPI0010314EDB|nr:ATP-binding protein [Streptomyces otsuchiensis]
MPEESPLIRSLSNAVEAAPDDVPLRLHLAGLLLDEGRQTEAIGHLARVLQAAPDVAEARELMARAVGTPAPAAPPAAPAPPAPVAAEPPPAEPAVAAEPAQEPVVPTVKARPTATEPAVPVIPVAARPAPEPVDAAPPEPSVPAPSAPEPAPSARPFDWRSAEQEMADVVEPRFVESSGRDDEDEGGPRLEEPLRADGGGSGGDWEVERSADLRLDDVGGMQEVKDRLESAFLAPLRNPELRKLYGKSLRGGLLLYGPPGCGKTFIARAVAGELGANFLSVSISDILDMYIGNSERNIREIFETARRSSPCVLFFDELDALGAKRSMTRNSGMRNTVNQLLTELDGVTGSANDGVFVLGATNHPWDVDTALRRPGRFDRMLLVLPPDQPAREAILSYHLRNRPITGVDLGKLARRTEGLSGADLAHLCEAAAERALMDSARSGEVRMISMKDLLTAAKEVRPSTDPWFATARHVAMFSNEGGTYDELLHFLKRARKL